MHNGARARQEIQTKGWVFCRAFLFSDSLPPSAKPGRGNIPAFKIMADSFYKSARWKKKRELILKRDSYQCQYFKRYGRICQANTVHHIFPRDKYPQYQWENWNLISLSHDAHNRMHYRLSNELTEEGMELLKRTARKEGIEL